MQIIKTEMAPVPVGHYSQAIVHNSTVYVSGLLPVIPGTHERVTGTVEEQAKQIFKNLTEILKAANSSLGNVVKTTIYIPDIEYWDSVNKIYAEAFGSHKPARVIVPTNTLHYGFKIEIDAIAASLG